MKKLITIYTLLLVSLSVLGQSDSEILTVSTKPLVDTTKLITDDEKTITLHWNSKVFKLEREKSISASCSLLAENSEYAILFWNNKAIRLNRTDSSDMYPETRYATIY